MFKYLIQDLMGTIRYVPYGVVIGLCLCIMIRAINNSRRRRGKAPRRLWAPVCFFTYLALMGIITFLSREDGSAVGMDLQIGSGLHINARNDAYLVENILLFVPYGFCYAWYRCRKGILFSGMFVAFTTSFLIEVMQLITERGIFQLDDIITNTIGGVLGVLIFQIPFRVVLKVQRK